MSGTTKPSQLHFDRSPVMSFHDLLSRYGEKEFQSPLRSTVPLLSLVKDGRSVLQEVLTTCGLPADSNLHFEYTVDSPRGEGIASHTDVMVRFGGDQLALECKWTEPRYETVGKWIVKPPDPRKDGKPADPGNRRKRIEGWLQLLQPHATCDLQVEAFSDAVYQMVHRAASACAGAERPQLAYLLFTPLPDGTPVHRQHYEDDLRHLHQKLGSPPGFQFHLIEVEIAPTKAFQAIQGLPKASVQTAQVVQEALLNSSLFDFRLKSITAPAAG